ncbi:MAG: WG repeat-containing protein [Ferruginibacter sp.]
MKKLLTLLLLLPVTALCQKWEKDYDYVDNCICGLSKVQKAGKVGYVNKEGQVMIPLQYDEGLTFREGFAAVRVSGKWQYLDSTGKAITEAVFDEANSFSNGLAPVSKNNVFGFINTKGDIVIPLQFSGARNFTEGLAPAANMKGYWGFIDTEGKWVIKPVYDFTDSFDNGEARVMKDQKVFYINKENKMLHE